MSHNAPFQKASCHESFLAMPDNLPHPWLRLRTEGISSGSLNFRFKNRQPRPLGGNRSISEDSIFSPEQREPNLQALKKAAVSEESLPKSAFQAELFSKLSKRRSQYSDEDDGLPHSPTPPVTTADIIMGGPLKPLPAAGKSTSRESDNSLISNDASDNEEDDPFKTQWKSSVASKVSKTAGQAGGGAETPIDFEKMGQTELLKSDVAKDRISIKPRSRKTNRQSRKQRESQSPHSLPSLNEESSPKSRVDPATTSPMTELQTSSGGKQEGSLTTSKPLSSPVEKTAGLASHHPLAKPSETSPSLRRPLSAAASPLTSPAEKKEAPKEEKRASLSSDFRPLKEDTKEARPSVRSPSALKEEEKQAGFRAELKSPTVKEYSGVKPSVDMTKSEPTESESRPKLFSAAILSASKTMESLKKESDSDSSVTAGRELGGSMMSRSMCAVPSSKSSGTSEVSSNSAKPKVEFLSSSLRSSGSTSSSSTPALHADSKSAQVTGSSVKTSTTADRTASPVLSKPSPPAATVAASPEESRKEGLRQTDRQASPAYSPKDDYKLRRQSRSKTLPEQPISKEEPFAAKVQRAASHRAEPASSQNTSPETSPRHRENVAEISKTKEPEWFALARRKTGRQESDEKKGSPSPTREPAPAKDTAPSTSQGTVSSAPAPKEESASNPVQTSSNISVSSAASRFGEGKVSEMSRLRGGSVKTSPTKTPVFTHRGSSVKVQSVKTELGTASSSSVTPSSVKTSAVPFSTSSSSASGAKQDEVKDDSKASESFPLKEAPKWKKQSVKPPPAFSPGSSSGVSSSRFPSVKTSSQTGPASSSMSTKTDTKPLSSSPAKTAPLTKTPSEEKDKPSVPAWRANLSQKKPAPSEIKIELIESKSSKPPASSAGSKKEDSGKKDENAKKEESVTKVTASTKDPPSDQCRSSAAPGGSSKVMNLLKNFENVPGVS
ncbi:hypothetical protein ACOMHN_045343 [Nucella lapillus]